MSGKSPEWTTVKPLDTKYNSFVVSTQSDRPIPIDLTVDYRLSPSDIYIGQIVKLTDRSTNEVVYGKVVNIHTGDDDNTHIECILDSK